MAKATLVFHVNRVVTAGPMRLSTLAGPFQEATVVQASAPPAGAVIGQVDPVQGINLVDVTALVQQWVTSTGAAFGIEVAADPGGWAALLMDSRENTATSFAAEVRVVLSGPALAAVCALSFRNGIATPAVFATTRLRRQGIRACSRRGCPRPRCPRLPG